jgi:hexosaminidase
LISKRPIALALLLLSWHGITGATTASGDAPKLIPMPREYSPREPLSLAHGVSVVTDSDPEDLFAAHDLSAFFENLNLRKGHGTAVIELLRAQSRSAARLLSNANIKIDEPMQQEGYTTLPTKKGLAVIAPSAAGIFYGAQTIKQLTTGEGSSATLERAVIRDWPAMRYRGISDDVCGSP